MPIRLDTPIDTYTLRDRTVYVKRDDLMGDGEEYPPWGKLDGIWKLIAHGNLRGPIAHLSVDGSWSGWALALICAAHNIEFIYAYPDSKKFNRAILDHVRALCPSTRFHPMKPNIYSILYNKLKSDAQREQWTILPVAFDHPMYHAAMGARLRETLAQISVPIHNLVVSSGSGVTVSALISALGVETPFDRVPMHVYTTAVSHERTVRAQIERHFINDSFVHVRTSEFAFHDRMNTYHAPFPCNQFWDVKQWHWLEHNIQTLGGNTLFWNLGGLYAF